MLEFRLFQTPVRIRPFFWLVAGVISWMSAEGTEEPLLRVLASVPIVLLGVLVHEFGHVAAAKQFGLNAAVELYGLGGVTRWRDQGRPLSPPRRLWISFAGPLAGMLVGVVLGVVLLLASPSSAGLAYHLLWFGIWVNFGWGVLNLFPMLPLDGGHILTAALEWVAGPRGRTVALWLSLFIGVTLGLVAIAYGAWEIFIIAVFLGLRNLQALRADRVLGADLHLVPQLREAQRALEQGAHETAYGRALEVARAASMPAVRIDALTVAAYAAASAGEGDRARGLLEELPSNRRSEPLLRGLIHHADGEYERAVPLLEAAYQSGAGFVQERLADSLAQSDQWARACDLFAGAQSSRATVRTLRALERGAYDSGAFLTSATLGGVLFERQPSATYAYNVACSFARAGEAVTAFEWLERAVQRGFDRFELLDRDADLADLRTRDDWERRRATLVDADPSTA